MKYLKHLLINIDNGVIIVKTKTIFITILIILSILTIKQQYLCNNLQNKDLIIDDFQIGGIKLGESIDIVINKMKESPKIFKINDEVFGCVYPGIEIEYNNYTKEIISITVYKTGIMTPRGIMINDNEKKVINKYGETEKIDGVLYYEKYISKEDLDYIYAIDFLIKKGKVKRIRIYFAYN